LADPNNNCKCGVGMVLDESNLVNCRKKH